MKLFPKTITGPLHAQNKGACDWGWQGILAYGCQNLVTVVDPNSVQIIQVLDKHKGVVTQVKWAHENYHHDLNSPYSLRLASADNAGVIVVWDVAQGTSRSDFSDGNKPVLALEWLRNQDASRDLLLALHPPYSLILWNADTGTRLWKKSYTETLLSFTFDPFNGKNLAFLGQDCIIFVNDFVITKTPSSNGKKFYISNPSTQGMSRSSSSGSLDRKGSASKNLAKRMSRILVGESKPSKPNGGEEESVALNECLQLSFHHSCRHHILLLYAREILILDLQINQTVGIIAMDRTSSPFTQVVSCWQRDVLMCLHENGSLSVRVRRKTNTISTPAPEGHGAFDDTPPNVSMDVAYDLRCQSDPLRVTRHNRVYGASLCPVSENNVALIMSDSRVIFWELQTAEIHSKRYRDKLRTEVKALEALLPLDRTSLNRKLDSQTVFRLVIALLRTKGYFQAVGQAGLQPNEPQHAVNHCFDFNPSCGVDNDDVVQLVQGQDCLQVLDGFLIMLTADGTVLYVSDNVLQYLGYNQVDLMHRCLYSIVHPDDMTDLRIVLETSLGHFIYPYDHQGTQEASHLMEECNLAANGACNPLSFICRMRCFSGSSVGYLKMHCSGKIVHLSSLPKTKRSSNNVVLLFCNPFMLRAAEFTTDLQKNVFWTKHDLDLNIKEVDKKGAEIIGFQSEEIEAQSFYSLIHPEDLTALAACHKMLVDSSEVQTVHFRIQTKGNDWVWLTSRGKVISKNSKKFSIAFSHCPLREEDSTYIQQEAILRRRYAISDLMCLTQLKHSFPPPPSSSSATDGTENKQSVTIATKGRKRDQQHRIHPYSRSSSPSGGGSTKNGSNGGGGAAAGKSAESSGKGKDEDGPLDTSCILEVSCPSSWHAMSDRHSPVLPSSHVAHKISQREKQIQFQEFCRRQQLENGSHSNQEKFSNSWNRSRHGQRYSASPTTNPLTSLGHETLPPENSEIPAACIGVPPVPHANSACFYPSEYHATETFGPCADYGFYQSPNVMASYIHHWYNNPGGGVMVNQPPAGTACLTPTRSPHQLCGYPVPSMQASASNQCSFQAGQPPDPSQVFQSHPDHQSSPLSSSCRHPSSSPCRTDGHQSVSVAYSTMSMPPSPPPSPPPLTVGPHRPNAAPYHQLGSGFCDSQQFYRMEWLQSSPQQSYFTGYSCQQQQPPPPYPSNQDSNSVSSTSHAATKSTISDLKKTTEKFLLVKTETDCAEGKESQAAASECVESTCSINGSENINSREPAWALNHQLDSAGKLPNQVNQNTHLSQQINRNNPNNFHYSHHPSMGKNSDLPIGYLPQAIQQAQMIQPFFQTSNSSAAAAAQYMGYPYTLPHQTNFGSPPAYPFSMYPNQLSHQPGQYQINGFYSSQGHTELKADVDFPRPLMEHPADLPSIGSFLEYLNEV